MIHMMSKSIESSQSDNNAFIHNNLVGTACHSDNVSMWGPPSDIALDGESPCGPTYSNMSVVPASPSQSGESPDLSFARPPSPSPFLVDLDNAKRDNADQQSVPPYTPETLTLSTHSIASPVPSSLLPCQQSTPKTPLNTFHSPHVPSTSSSSSSPHVLTYPSPCDPSSPSNSTVADSPVSPFHPLSDSNNCSNLSVVSSPAPIPNIPNFSIPFVVSNYSGYVTDATVAPTVSCPLNKPANSQCNLASPVWRKNTIGHYHWYVMNRSNACFN